MKSFGLTDSHISAYRVVDKAEEPCYHIDNKHQGERRFGGGVGLPGAYSCCRTPVMDIKILQ